MLPSSTVENYLKAIYHGAGALTPPQRLMPMGQLAGALGITPGTATTMVKTLAESGLVEYEPYAGVALTAAGEKLAALVLRRHRLVELFLVRMMGYSWDEVHDEAEQLEHVVSDRLIDRIDEMLGWPEVDPHGDPIPNSQGLVKAQDAQSLLTCPLHTPVVVTRVIDQDKVFLRFIENHALKPGETIEVEDRNTASDSVRVRGKGEHMITIGMRAASKLMVQLGRPLILLLLLAAPSMAQDPAPAGSSRPWRITDNSFLVEEAFNQEAKTVQNIFTVERGNGEWTSAFTQEWPLAGQRHQISYTIPYEAAGSGRGMGDIAVHYRLQVSDDAAGHVAFSPRISLIVPSGSVDKRLGSGNPGWQVNLPVSKQFGDFYVHGNAGFTNFPAAERPGATFNLFSPAAAVSAIWRTRDMFNVMLEAVVEREAQIEDNGGQHAVQHSVTTTVSPGFRTGWNRGTSQIVIGVGLPITIAGGEATAGVLAYGSYELPFAR
jgi:DtxR family transcriptional regulator, Mn-dependent transcriptional regulator